MGARGSGAGGADGYEAASLGFCGYRTTDIRTHGIVFLVLAEFLFAKIAHAIAVQKNLLRLPPCR